VYHIEKNGYMTGEIVVFNPARCGVKEVPIDSQGKSVSLESVLNLNTARCTVSFQGTTVAVRKPTRGGAASKLVVRDPNEFNDMLQRKDPNAINLQKQAIAAAKVWKKHIKVIDHCAPHPNTPVSSWLGR
jgi:hypothetical protein